MTSYILSKTVLMWNNSSCTIGDSVETVIRDGTSILTNQLGATYTNNRISAINNYVFANNQPVQHVSFLNCTSIFPSAFYTNRNLLTAYLPNCTWIATMAFMQCSNLSSIVFSSHMQSINMYAFAGCTKLSGSINLEACQTIGDAAFQSTAITAFNLNSTSMTTVPSNLFQYCSSLSAVSWNGTITSIGAEAFNWCSKLSTLNIANLSTQSFVIGPSAFIGCSTLTSLEIPHCTGLYSSALASCGISQLEILEPLTISSYAIAYCTNLERVSMPECTFLPFYAFYGCSKLSSVYLPKCSVIAQSAFGRCIGLSTITLNNCSQIRSSAFTSCTNLKTVILGRSDSVCSLTSAVSWVFYLAPITSIYVPASLVSAYKANTRWSAWSSRILAIPETEGD